MSIYPWELAPDWAQYVTTDEDGDRCWHEYEPEECDGYWLNEGRMHYAGKMYRVECEKRPEL